MLPTRLGDTLVIFVCAIPGPEFNQRLNTVLTTVASLEADLPEEIEAVAAGLVNCDDAEALNCASSGSRVRPSAPSPTKK